MQTNTNAFPSFVKALVAIAACPKIRCTSSQEEEVAAALALAVAEFHAAPVPAPHDGEGTRRSWTHLGWNWSPWGTKGEASIREAIAEATSAAHLLGKDKEAAFVVAVQRAEKQASMSAWAATRVYQDLVVVAATC